MDLLEIILLIVRSLSKPRQPELPALTPQQAAAQQAAMQQRLAAMQKSVATQQARVQPHKGVRQPTAARSSAPARPPLVARPPSNTPLSATKPTAQTPAPRRSDNRSGMLVPLILGDVLAPPLALRDPEL